MSMRLTILGANSALPAHGRFPTAQLLQIDQNHILLDCGEGTQLRLRALNTKWSKIDYIFISHFHGDHFFGLPGFLTSLSLLGRERKMTIIAPQGVENILNAFFQGCGTKLVYELEYIEIDHDKSITILEVDQFEVQTIPMDHRIATFGYLFKKRQKKRNINPDKIQQYGLSFDQIKSIKQGHNLVLSDGFEIPNVELTYPPDPPKKYAFCSDTRYNPEISKLIAGVDLLYHEATYLDELKQLAEHTLHTTAKEAGQLARDANVKHLLIGHYSSRYQDLLPLKQEAERFFSKVSLAVHGLILEI